MGKGAIYACIGVPFYRQVKHKHNISQVGQVDKVSQVGHVGHVCLYGLG